MVDVRDYDMRVEVRIWSEAVLNAAGGTSRYMIETCGDDIAGHDPFAAPAATRERICSSSRSGRLTAFPCASIRR